MKSLGWFTKISTRLKRHYSDSVYGRILELIPTASCKIRSKRQLKSRKNKRNTEQSIRNKDNLSIRTKKWNGQPPAAAGSLQN